MPKGMNVRLSPLEVAVLEFVEQEGYIPGENLGDVRRVLMGRMLIDLHMTNVAEAINRLIRKGVLRLSIRKNEFLHVVLNDLS